MNLLTIENVSRYINSEVNSAHKRGAVKVALAFPDAYEVGMSHLGLKILYHIINSIPYASAERVFAPWTDYERLLKANHRPLTSLESGAPLNEFDIVGFTLQYELSYTNILTMLNLGGIPIKSEERIESKKRYPLIIAGGPCAVNPMPLKPFIDAFVIGDGEEVVPEILALYHDGSQNNTRQLLCELAHIEGVYVPMTNRDKKVKRRIVSSLEDAPYPVKPIVPYMQIVHDRVAIEVSRGCTRGCRFCQAGMIYRPVRQRSPEKVIDLARESLKNTGHEEVSFLSLSIGDYEALHTVLKAFKGDRRLNPVALSLPSLRVGAVNREIVQEIKRVRKTGFTIAPEAGSERLRSVINKDFTEEEYLRALDILFSEGWSKIKLYFMLGLPTEEEQDIEGVVAMTQEALKMGKKAKVLDLSINVSLSAFTPKPHTPFQWLGQTTQKTLEERQIALGRALNHKKLHLKRQHIPTSILEAVMSRGDESLAAVIERAWSIGCRFDGWSEQFDFQKWLTAFEAEQIDPYRFAERTFSLDAPLPWDKIDSGVENEFLKAEFNRAMLQKRTEDCKNRCRQCGLACLPSKKQASNELQRATLSVNLSSPSDIAPIADKTSYRFRVMHSKTGSLKFLSNRQTMTALIRAFRRADITVQYSEGFHPHPKLSFGPALPVGVEGLREFFDIELTESLECNDMITLLNASLPDGLRLLKVKPIDKKETSLNAFISKYIYSIKLTELSLVDSLNAFMASSNRDIFRDGKRLDVRKTVEQATIEQDVLTLSCVDQKDNKVRIFELLQEALQLSRDEVSSLEIKRLALLGFNEKWIEPIEHKTL